VGTLIPIAFGPARNFKKIFSKKILDKNPIIGYNKDTPRGKDETG